MFRLSGDLGTAKISTFYAYTQELISDKPHFPHNPLMLNANFLALCK
jgi:hypothetical protein